MRTQREGNDTRRPKTKEWLPLSKIPSNDCWAPMRRKKSKKKKGRQKEKKKKKKTRQENSWSNWCDCGVIVILRRGDWSFLCSLLYSSFISISHFLLFLFSFQSCLLSFFEASSSCDLLCCCFFLDSFTLTDLFFFAVKFFCFFSLLLLFSFTLQQRFPSAFPIPLRQFVSPASAPASNTTSYSGNSFLSHLLLPLLPLSFGQMWALWFGAETVASCCSNETAEVHVRSCPSLRRIWRCCSSVSSVDVDSGTWQKEWACHSNDLSIQRCLPRNASSSLVATQMIVPFLPQSCVMICHLPHSLFSLTLATSSHLDVLTVVSVILGDDCEWGVLFRKFPFSSCCLRLEGPRSREWKRGSCTPCRHSFSSSSSSSLFSLFQETNLFVIA